MGIYETLKYTSTSSAPGKKPASGDPAANVSQDIKDLYAQVSAQEEKRKEEKKKTAQPGKCDEQVVARPVARRGGDDWEICQAGQRR
ncbi:unnamed protein product [Cutaneotrichosporon oleaginosum]